MYKKYNRLKKLKVRIIKKKKEEKMEENRQNEKKKKENYRELQRPNIEAEVYNSNKKCDWIYTYTYTPISKIKTVQQKWSTIDLPGKERNQNFYLPEQN